MECNVCEEDITEGEEYTVNGNYVCGECYDLMFSDEAGVEDDSVELTGVKPPEPNVLYDAIEFFYQSHTDESYNHLVDRFGERMVDKYRLGWAPPTDELYTYLSEEKGYTDEQILTTGLFTESDYNDSLNVLWKGRYIFPYYNQEMEPVYAIARSTGNKGGGAAGYDGHPEDFLSGKYAKLRHTSDECLYDEPILGLHTITEDVDSLIVTEGIADLIQADKYGYPVISPVTTQFKTKHIDEVIAITEKYDINEVIFIPDNEEPAEDTIEKYGEDAAVGEGLKGAIIVSDKILDQKPELNIKVTKLPREDDARKIDLDEFLKTYPKERFDEVLQSNTFTKYVIDYDFYTVYKEQQTNTVTEYTYSSEATRNELYDLSLQDVLPENISVGYRGKNPLQHRGDSENYFIVKDVGGEAIAYDHKSHQTYNALTFILHKLGERSATDIEGPLTPRETYKVYKYAVDNGYLSEESQLPPKAIEYIVEQQGFSYSTTKLPPDTYYATVDYIQNNTQYNINKKTNYKTDDYYRQLAKLVLRPDITYNLLVSDDEYYISDVDIEYKELLDDKKLWRPKGFDEWFEAPLLVGLASGDIELDELDRYTLHRIDDKTYMKYCIFIASNYPMYIDDIPLKLQRAIANLYSLNINENGTLTTQSYKTAINKFKEMTQ